MAEADRSRITVQRCGVPASLTLNSEVEDSTVVGILAKLLVDEGGQDLIEYALVFTFLALGSVVTMKGLATALGTFFGTLGTTLTSSI